MPPSIPPSFSPAELSYLHTSLSSHPPIRPDSRSSTDFRPLSAETGILPLTNGSAHVSFSDGSEAIVGVKLETEKTLSTPFSQSQNRDDDAMQLDNAQSKGSSNWISLTLNLPSTRDDDSILIHLEETLREPLLLSSLKDRLVINTRFHWHLYLDLLLISPHGLASYPLPLLSMATHLALRDTCVPRLKSEGEEDPVADDDWEASVPLYAASGDNKPPVTLLVVSVGDNIVFDPSYSELKVADAIVAVSVALVGGDVEANKVLAVRTINTPARDTMKGVPKEGEQEQQGREVQGVWRPKVGGVKRVVLKEVIKAVLGGEGRAGVAKDVFEGLATFVAVEQEMDRRTVVDVP